MLYVSEQKALNMSNFTTNINRQLKVSDDKIAYLLCSIHNPFCSRRWLMNILVLYLSVVLPSLKKKGLCLFTSLLLLSWV